MTATTTRLTWARHGRGFYRSADGRFDVAETALGYVVALDWDAGVTFRAPSLEAAYEWCERRATEGGK